MRGGDGSEVPIDVSIEEVTGDGVKLISEDIVDLGVLYAIALLARYSRVGLAYMDPR